MESRNNRDLPIPNSLEQTQSVGSHDERDLVDNVARLITPTIEEVADWRYIDAKLFVEWERPLVRILRFFVDDCVPTTRVKRIIDIRDAEPAGIAA